MHRRVFLTGLTACLLGARSAFAAGLDAEIVAQMRKAGFTRIAVETTWLGRLRITAQKGEVSREVVLNPRTGEILRDILRKKDGTLALRSSEDRATSTAQSSAESGGSGASDDGSAGSGDDGSGDQGSGDQGSGDSGHDDSSGDDSSSGGDDHGDGDNND